MKAIGYAIGSIAVGVFLGYKTSAKVDTTCTVVLGKDTLTDVKYYVVKDSTDITFVFPELN